MLTFDTLAGALEHSAARANFCGTFHSLGFAFLERDLSGVNPLQAVVLQTDLVERRRFLLWNSCRLAFWLFELHPTIQWPPRKSSISLPTLVVDLASGQLRKLFSSRSLHTLKTKNSNIVALTADSCIFSARSLMKKSCTLPRKSIKTTAFSLQDIGHETPFRHHQN
jgi:hypothetical protein